MKKKLHDQELQAYVQKFLTPHHLGGGCWVMGVDGYWVMGDGC